MQGRAPTLFVVDDDPDMRASLSELAQSVSLPVRTFGSAPEFLAAYDNDPGCVLADLRMPEMTGLEMQSRLHDSGAVIPLIFITAYGDVRTAVRAIKFGAMDFVEKPIAGAELLELIHAAIQADAAARKSRLVNADVASRLAILTRREREVFCLIAEGRNLPEAAQSLKRSVKTIEAHAARIKKKLGVRNRAELVRLAVRAGIVAV